MANIINTKVSGMADLKIEDSVIRDSSVTDCAVVYISDESLVFEASICGNAIINDSKVKYADLKGDVEIKHSIIEGCIITGCCKFINCIVKQSEIHDIDIVKDICIETIKDGEIFVPAGCFDCEVTMKPGLITAKFHTYNDVLVFKKRKLSEFLNSYYKL